MPRPLGQAAKQKLFSHAAMHCRILLTSDPVYMRASAEQSVPPDRKVTLKLCRLARVCTSSGREHAAAACQEGASASGSPSVQVCSRWR